MKHLWTWSGKYFGYLNGNELRTHDGRCVERFYGDEVYDSNGYYLGEIKNGNRLITKRSGRTSRKSSFSSCAKMPSIAKLVGYAGYAMVSGYKDFPGPEEF